VRYFLEVKQRLFGDRQEQREGLECARLLFDAPMFPGCRRDKPGLVILTLPGASQRTFQQRSQPRMMGTSIGQIEDTYHRFLGDDEERYCAALDTFGVAV
jgi:hypothetical protein